MPEPYTVRLDANTARELTTKGATLVLLDVPEGALVGLDQQTFLVGHKFKGVKMVPPGVHVIAYAAADSQGGFGPTTASFITARGGEVLAWRWKPQEEVLEKILDEGELSTLENAVKLFQLDHNLAPYNLSAYPTWRQLSSHITLETLDSVAPVGGNINILAEAAAVGGGVKPTAAEAALEDALEKGRAQRAERAAQQQAASLHVEKTAHDEKVHLSSGEEVNREYALPFAPQMAAAHAGRCFFTPLPRLVKRPGLTPAELTALNLDKSAVLEDLLSQKFHGSEEAFLGEFEFAFLAFLLGHSLEAFSQWKDFIRLMMGCEDAVVGEGRTRLFTRFLQSLHTQLIHTLAPGCSPEAQAAPFGTPMVEELLEDSFLRRLCTGWLRWVASEGSSVQQPLADAAAAVAAVLRRTVGWECGPVESLVGGDDEDDDEDGPVVVEGIDPELLA